jgi:hypothetical protein
MRLAIAIAVVLGCVMDIQAGNATDASTVYSPDPRHLWNRLNETLFQRTAQDGKHYGLDELDILYWGRTTNLLAEPSHHRALAVLDEFINVHGEKLMPDPLKRAWLQRDLWALFDWVARPGPAPVYDTPRKELQSRLAVIIRRLALTTNEIAALPNNYALTDGRRSPDLPRGLFETNSDWVNLAPDLLGNEEIAPTHDHSFQGHSAFLVMLHLPAGRPAAKAYLEQLRTVEHYWIYVTNTSPFATNSPREMLSLNTNLPEFPTNTEWAIVRRMLLIDSNGNLHPTPITESIQVRRYFGFENDLVIMTNSYGYQMAEYMPPQKVFEFQMDRWQRGGLREIAPDEKDFLHVHFLGMGIDPFEWPSSDSRVPDSSTFKGTVLNDCRICHLGPGIHSVAVYSGNFQLRDAREGTPQLFECDINREMRTAIDWKQGQFNWGLLQGLWDQND